jgi:uncharacterized repeat protein (TIGR01451 family)
MSSSNPFSDRDPSFVNNSFFESLEDRVLFDGVPDATFILPQADVDQPVPAHVQDVQKADFSGQRELVLIDGNVANREQFLSDIVEGKPDSTLEIRFLDANQDGVSQISQILAESKGEYTTIHIISHGDEAEVILGNSKLTADNLNRYADQLAGWADAMTEDADLLFYGCDLAGSSQGEKFIESISAITGADVAASDDVTGAEDKGGDWELEFVAGVVESAGLAAYNYTETLALSDAQLNIVSDGTPTWDPDNNPGNDTDGANGIIRSHDTIAMEVFYNTDSAGATDLNFTSTLPQGLVWDFLPASAALDPRSMIVDSVTGLPGGDMRSIIAYLPDVAGTFTSSIVFEARALGGQQGTALNGVTFEVDANENATPLPTDSFDFTLSAAANMDIQLLSPTFRGVFSDAAGVKDGAVYSYGIGLLGDHPTRTGSDAFKGSAPLEDPVTFDLDLSSVSPNSTVFSWGPSLGTATDNADDGVTRNYERFVDTTGATTTVWSQSNRPSGQFNEASTATWNVDRSTPDSGDWNLTGSSAGVYGVEIVNHDTYGMSFPNQTGAGRAIPASDKWFASGQIHVWIPICDIDLGDDGIAGTADDGVLTVIPEITNFDPDDEWGVTNNFGTGIEDTSNNSYEHTVVSTSLGGPSKRIAEFGVWRWVETSSAWHAGDGETAVGHQWESTLSSGRNLGVLGLEGVVWGDKFDNTASKIVPVSTYVDGLTHSTSGWGRAFQSGGNNPGWLTEGTDYIIEFGTGGVGGAAGGWTDWDSMGDATLADSETSTVWTTDPTDIASLGGTADPVTGVSDAITKYRIKLLTDLEPGAVVTSFVSMETTGHSTLELTGDNPAGDIIANFVAGTADYLLNNANTTDDWRTSDYDPEDNGFYPEGASGDVFRGDRLHIVEADVDVDKEVIDLGAGNNYLAGTAATFELDATVTIPGDVPGAPAQNVVVTDMLPAGLTVIGGSAQPAAGYSFTAGDGSTISVQSVEYFDPATSTWSNTWTYGATGIRWDYGTVPLGTALPTMTFDVLIPYDAQNGQSWTNTAVITSDSDDSPEEFRNSSAGIVAVQVAAMAAGKQVVTPLVPEDTTIIYDLGIANVSDDKDVPWFDLVDILPYNGDFEGSSNNSSIPSGLFSYVEVSGLDPNLEVYVTTASQATLDGQDGTIDGYADPGTAAAGDAWFVAEGTGIWQHTLDDVQNAVAGAPTMDMITAIRVVSDKAVTPYLPAGTSTNFFLELTPQGNVGIPSDWYTNKFAARTDPGQLPLPVSSAPVTAYVVAPDIEIEKEVAIDETHVNNDGTDDSHWTESVNFDDTDKAYFRIKVTNTGTADFLGATVTDSLPAGATLVGGTPLASTGDISGFPATWTFDLGAGDTAWLVYQIDVNDSGNYPNVADVEATDAWGEPVEDSDDAEANFVTEISAAKQQIGAVRSTTNSDWFEVTYEVELMNTSVFDLANLTLTENLLGAFGPGFMGVMTPPAITASVLTGASVAPTTNGAFDGNADDQILNADGLLESGDSVTVQYTVYVDPALLPDPANTVNQVEGGGVTGSPGGTPTTDLSDDGSDPDSDNPGERGDDGMGGTDDPTPLVLPSIDLTKEIVGTAPAASGVNGNFDVTYEFMITNDGTVDLDNIALTEDFLANLGGAFIGVVNGPVVTMTTATDNPDFNFGYDGGADSNVFNNLPTTDTFTYGGSTANTTNRALYFGDQKIVVDPNGNYVLSVDAFAGDGAGGSFDPAAGHYMGFVSYDIDGNVVNPYSYAKFAGSTDTTLAAPLNPGDTTITLTNAAGWSNAGGGHTRTIAWYGYTDSTGYTYPDYDYTRNYLANAWAPGAVSGNTITLSAPWAGPALAAGDAVRNSTSGGSYQYVLLGAGSVPQTTTNYSTTIGGGYIQNGVLGTSMFRPGTHSISSLVLADWLNGGTGTPLNIDNFQLETLNMSLMEPGQKVTFQITVEVDPDAPGAIYDGITGDGDNSLENQASVTAEDPWNDIPVADTSDDPTDPTDAEYGDDSDPDDPTSLLFPNIELTKAIVGTPVPASSGAFGNMDVTFEFEITNSGNESLDNISLLEDLLTQYGGAFQGIVLQGTAPAVVTFTDATNPVEINPNFDGGISDAELIDNTSGTNELAMGETITIQIIVEVDPDNATALYTNGMLVNQASVTGIGTTTGAVTDDDSDDPNDSSNNDNDADNDPDDPTTWQIPIIDLTKTLVGDPVAASSGTQGNFDVTYDFTITNFGNAPMDMLSLEEDVAAQYGTAFVAIVSQAGIPATIQSSTMTDAPEINASYDGGTTDAEVFDNTGGNTNLIAGGESVTIRIIFEVDPNAVGAIFDANNNLVNQATVSGNHDGTTYSDDSDDPNDSTDNDPNDDNNPGDPNRLFIADVSLAKQVVGTPVSLGNGNFEVTYQLVVENTGNASLDISLDDDIDAQFGAAFVSAGGLTMMSQPAGNPITLDLANWDGDLVTEMVNQTQTNILEAGEFFIVQFTVEVDPDATGTSQPLDNQATVMGDAVDENGNPMTDSNGDPVVVDDLSDDGTDPETNNPGADGDTGGSNDPTPLLLPAMSVGKQANTVTVATDAMGNELTGSFDVQYLVVVENTGTIELTNLQLLDDLTTNATFGDAYDPTLLSGPTDRTGLVTGPAIVSHTLANAGDLPNLNSGFLGGGAQTNLFDGTSGALQTGEQIVISFTIRIDAEELVDGDSTDGMAQNQVQGTADSDQGPVDDLSDDGLDPNSDNGDGGIDDPTPFEVPQIRLYKSHSDRIDNGDGTSTITVTLTIDNSGTVDLTNLSLTEDLATQFGSAFISATTPTITGGPFNALSNVPASLINSAWSGDTSLDVFDATQTNELLVAGDEFEIQFDVIVDPDLIDDDSDYLQNTATISGDGQNFDGTTISVDDESGADDGSGIDTDEPTDAIVPEIAIAKVAGDAAANGDDWDVTFTMVVENTGSVDLNNLTLFDDITAQFGNAFVGVTGLSVQSFVGSGTIPVANAAWTGDTTQTMLTGGHLDPGDRFEVVYTVTIDPDGIDSTSQGLNNQATVQGDAIDENGDPLTDDSGMELTAEDDSDDGTSPQGDNPGENGDEGTSDDPTPIIIADVSIAKEVVGQPTQLPNGNFAVDYQLVVENIGTVHLSSMTLVDDIQTQFGAAVFQGVSNLAIATGPTDPFSSITLDPANWDGTGATDMLDQSVANSLAIGDIFTFTFTVEIDAAAATGILDNQATVGGTGVDDSGTPYTDANGDDITTTDDSDSGATTGDDNAGEPGDSGGSDDPTPLYIPDIGLAKQAGDAVANGDNWDVEFTLVWENTGTVDLTNLTMFDGIAAQFGNAFVSISGLTVQNFVGTGTAPTANVAWMGDTTQTMITGGMGNVDDTFEVVFTVTIDPDGIDNVSQGLENQATTSGEALDENGDPLTNPDGSPVTANDDSDNGTNATDENGEDNGDGTFGNDPTPIVIADISVVKATSGIPVALNNGNFEVTYELVIENIGTVDLANLSLVEDLQTHFGSVFQSAGNLTLGTVGSNSTITLDTANWNGDTSTEMIDQAAMTLLAVGESFVVTFTVEVDPDAVGAPTTLENQVVVMGDAVDSSGNDITDSNGDPITTSDDSDDGTDPNGDNPNAQGDHGTSDDPTPLLIPDISIGKTAGDAIQVGDEWRVHFRLFVENTGTVSLDALTLFDDIAAQFGNALVSVDNLAIVNFFGSGTAPGANAAWTGDTTLDMLDGTGTLDVGDRFQVTFRVSIDPDGIDNTSQGLDNQAVVGGEGINPDGTPMTDDNGDPVSTIDESDDGTDVHGENGSDDGDGVANNDPTPIIIADISVTKEVFGTPVALSDGNFEVTYQLVVENTGTVDLANLTLIDDIATQYGAAYISAGGLTLITPPADAIGNVVVDSTWDGSSAIEMIDQAAATALAVGDSYVVQFTVVVDPDASGTSVPLDNQVVTGGDAVDENGDPYLDSNGDQITADDDSDTGSDPNGDNPGEQGDNGTSDDPTPLLLPDVSLAKSAGAAVANGDNWDVTFTLVYENTGTVTLDNLSLIDDIAAEFGNAFVSTTGVTIQNLVGTGTLPTANAAWPGGTAANMLVGGSMDPGASFEVVFTVTIDPDGIDSVSQGLENQATATGDGVNPDGTPMTDDSGNPVTVTDDSDNGTDPNGENGSEDTTDGVYGNDPTPIQIADLAIAKSIVGEPVLTGLGNYVVTYQLVIENTGTLDLGSLSLLEDLATQFGSAFVNAGNLSATSPSDPSSSIVVDSAGWNGSTSIEMMDGTSNVLAVGDSFTIQFDVEIDPRETTDPLVNQVQGAGVGVDENGDPVLDPNGNPIPASDDSDSGTDPGSSNPGDPSDEGTNDDPTLFDVPPVPLSDISGTVFQDDNDDGIQQPGDNGIEGVEVTLSGTDVFGNPVSVTVLTDSNGNYSFPNLNAGTYTLTQAQPDGFTDGQENGNPNWTIGNDVISNIDLGWGESSGTSTFAEILEPTTASGNPPRLPALSPISLSPIGNLLSSYLGGPGPIYSGVPINSNANPLQLDSGRSVLGGYVSSGETGDCGCPEPINPCCEPVDPCGQTLNWAEQPIVEEAVASEDCCDGEVVAEGDISNELVSEDVIQEEFVDQMIPCEDANPCEEVRRPWFLKRMSNWMQR